MHASYIFSTLIVLAPPTIGLPFLIYRGSPLSRSGRWLRWSFSAAALRWALALRRPLAEPVAIAHEASAIGRKQPSSTLCGRNHIVSLVSSDGRDDPSSAPGTASAALPGNRDLPDQRMEEGGDRL